MKYNERHMIAAEDSVTVYQLFDRLLSRETVFKYLAIDPNRESSFHQKKLQDIFMGFSVDPYEVIKKQNEFFDEPDAPASVLIIMLSQDKTEAFQRFHSTWLSDDDVDGLKKFQPLVGLIASDAYAGIYNDVNYAGYQSIALMAIPSIHGTPEINGYILIGKPKGVFSFLDLELMVCAATLMRDYILQMYIRNKREMEDWGRSI